MASQAFLEAAMGTGHEVTDDLSGAILDIVHQHGRCSTSQLTQALRARGIDIDPRAARSRLALLEAQGDVQRSFTSAVNCVFWEPGAVQRVILGTRPGQAFDVPVVMRVLVTVQHRQGWYRVSADDLAELTAEAPSLDEALSKASRAVALIWRSRLLSGRAMPHAVHRRRGCHWVSVAAADLADIDSAR